MFKIKKNSRVGSEMGNVESHQKESRHRNGGKKGEKKKANGGLHPLNYDPDPNPYKQFLEEEEQHGRPVGARSEAHQDSTRTAPLPSAPLCSIQREGEDEIGASTGIDRAPSSAPPAHQPSCAPPVVSPAHQPGSTPPVVSPANEPVLSSIPPKSVTSPRVEEDLVDYYTVTSDTVELSCRFVSDGCRLTGCEWTKDGKVLTEATCRLEGGTASVTLRDVTLEDAGHYTAEARNQHGATVQTYAHLHIYDVGDVKRLVNSKRTMMQDMDVISIFPFLKEKSILNEHKQQEIEKKATRWQQNDALVDYMLTRPAEEFKTLFMALREQGYAFIVENILKSEFVENGTRRKQSPAESRRTSFDETLYDVFDEAQYDVMRADGLSTQRIREKDQQAKERLDRELANYVLPGNRPDAVVRRANDVNIVFLGKAGTGKSATANTLAGEQLFRECRGSGAHMTGVEVHHIHTPDHRRFTVIDTPGFIAPNRSPEDIALEVAKIFELCPGGVHVFIYTQAATEHRFTPEQQLAKRQAELIFGERILKHTAMVLTHASQVFREEESLQKYVENEVQDSGMEVFVRDLQGHVVAIENKAESRYERSFMRQALLDMVDTVMAEVDYSLYTHEWFELAQRVHEERLQIRKHDLTNIRTTDTALFHQAFRLAKEVAHSMVKDYFKPKMLVDMAEEQHDGFKSARNLLTAQLESRLCSENEAMHRKLSRLCQAGLNPFRDIINELVHTGSCTHRFQQALQENNEEKKMLYRQRLQVQRSIQEVLHEMDARVKVEFNDSPEYSMWCSEQLRGDIQGRVQDKLASQANGWTEQEVQEEVEILIEFDVTELRYLRRIDVYVDDLDEVIWAEIQRYVRLLTRQQLQDLSDYDYQRIYVEVEHRLAPHVRAYFSHGFICEQIRRQASNKRTDLMKLVTSFSSTIYRNLQCLLCKCSIM